MGKQVGATAPTFEGLGFDGRELGGRSLERPLGEVIPDKKIFRISKDYSRKSGHALGLRPPPFKVKK